MRKIKLKKNMDKRQVNNLIRTWTKLEDNIYLGDKHPHNWKCKCGENIVSSWGNMRFRNKIECEKCKYLNQERRYKSEVEKTGEYEYVRSFRKGDILPDGRYVKFSPFIQIRHKHCNNLHEVNASTFINNPRGNSCPKCCGSYEKSFAYHIEQELGEPLEKYWSDKNISNPYHIWKNGTVKVFIKCQKLDYHGAYEISCSEFARGRRCSYCGNHKVHPRDSFAQYHIDNTDPNFLEKYWDYEKNLIDPFKISYSSNRNKVWIKCQNSELNKLNMIKKSAYHSSYEIKCNKFSQSQRCPLCNTFASKKVHPLDSFGYYHFDKVMSWHPDNDISPFRVSRNSNKKYKFICETCEEVWSSYIKYKQRQMVSKLRF